MSYSQSACDLRMECIEKIYSLIRIPNKPVKIEVSSSIHPIPYPPTIYKVALFEDSEVQFDFTDSKGNHYVNGTIMVDYYSDDYNEFPTMDEALEQDTWNDLVDLDLDTLCDVTDAVVEYFNKK